MGLKKYWLLLFVLQFAFSQSRQVTLENKIYNAVDVFVANPTVENLDKLEASEKTFHPKSKSEWLALVILQCNKAYYQNQLGFTKKAIVSYEKAWRWYQKKQLSDYDIVESCLQPLGNLYTIIGDYDNAENTIKQYFYIANLTNNQQQKYAAILNLSNVYQNTGKVNEAIDLLQKTLATEKLTSTQKGVLSNNLGANYLIIIKSDDAKKAFELSVNLLKLDSTQSENLSNAYRNLAKIYTQQHDYNVANSNMEKAYGVFYKSKNWEPRKEAKLYYDCAFLLFEQGRYEASKKFIVDIFTLLIPNYKRSNLLANKKSLYAETVLLDACDLQAAIYLAQNQPERALENYQLSFYMEDLFQRLLVYENSKIISQIRNRNRSEKCIAIYNSQYQKEKKISYLESAFLLAEQTKSAVLKQSLLDTKSKSREEKLMIEQLQNWNTIILKEQQKLDKADISKINEAIKKQNELMLLLKSKETKIASESKKELDIEALYSKLEKDNAIMIEYFVGKEKTYSFTLENYTMKLQIIAETFDEHSIIRDYLSFFKDANSIANNPKEFNYKSNTTYTLLKLPKKSSNKNLIIIPDGILNFLPFESLITAKSTTYNFAKMHYLLNDFKIGYNNSAEFYLNAIPFQHKKETVLGVFPLFEETDLELTFSKKELQNIKANFDGNYLVSKKATFENFKLNAPTFSILHLSTHASSGDIIEPSSIKFYDQEILYSELYNLDIHPDLVVLSACETGLGKLYKAEGAMSVARGFQFAGAQNLLFSLWKVNDYTTSVFMNKFYKNVKKGNSYFDSNHQAKLDFLADESIPNTKKSPYYWSAFVYYGTLENPHSKSNYFLWISVIVGLITLFLIFKFVTQRYTKKHRAPQRK